MRVCVRTAFSHPLSCMYVIFQYSKIIQSCDNFTTAFHSNHILGVLEGKLDLRLALIFAPQPITAQGPFAVVTMTDMWRHVPRIAS